jgi:hypothetical protein
MSSTAGAPKTASGRSSAIRGRKRSKRPTDTPARGREG